MYGYLVLTISDQMYIAWISFLITAGCTHTCTSCWFCWLVVLIIFHFGRLLPPSPQAFSLSGEILFHSFWSPWGPCGYDSFSHTQGQVKTSVCLNQWQPFCASATSGWRPKSFQRRPVGISSKARKQDLFLVLDKALSYQANFRLTHCYWRSKHT